MFPYLGMDVIFVDEHGESYAAKVSRVRSSEQVDLVVFKSDEDNPGNCVHPVFHVDRMGAGASYHSWFTPPIQPS